MVILFRWVLQTHFVPKLNTFILESVKGLHEYQCIFVFNKLTYDFYLCFFSLPTLVLIYSA